MASETHTKHPASRPGRLWHWLVTMSIMAGWSFKLLMMATFFVSMRIFWWFKPHQRRLCVEVFSEMGNMSSTKIALSDWEHTFFSWEHYKTEAKRMLLDSYKTVKLHGPVNNVDVITLEGNAAKLLDYSSSPDRPLVVNFGSCS